MVSVGLPVHHTALWLRAPSALPCHTPGRHGHRTSIRHLTRPVSGWLKAIHLARLARQCSQLSPRTRGRRRG